MKKTYLTRKDSIILSAIEILDELGIQELSIREIASRQGVSEPALYRHFKSKQDIILAVLDYYASFDEMIAKTIKDRNLKAKEGILFFIKSYAEYFENYPALTAIPMLYDVLKYDGVISQHFDKINKMRFDTLKGMIEKGLKDGQIKPIFSSEQLVDIINGLFRAIILRWRMNHFDFSLKKQVLSTLESLLKLC